MRAAILFAMLFCLLCSYLTAQPGLQLKRLKNNYFIQQEANRQKVKFSPEKSIADSNHVKQTIGNLSSTIQFEYSKEVWQHVALYSGEQQQAFEAALGLCRLYFPVFERGLAYEKVPEDFKFLPVALSALNATAKSRFGSSGIWQLPYPVAVKYGLKVTDIVDERNNDLKATRAAAKYLQDLFKQYNNWNLVLAAYTCGPAGVTRAMKRSGKTELWSIYPYLPDSQRTAIPAMAAAMYCVIHADSLELNAFSCNPWPIGDTVQSDTLLHFEPISQVTGIEMDVLKAYNPELIANRTPAKRNLYLPFKKGKDFYSLQDSIRFYQDSIFRKPEEIFVKEIPTTPKTFTDHKPKEGTVAVYYRIKSGDNLGYIADWYDVGLSELKAWNGLSSSFIDVGEQLTVYVPKGKEQYYERIDDLSFQQKQNLDNSTKTDSKQTTKRKKEKHKKPEAEAKFPPGTKYSWYTVKSGDSLYYIAKKYPGVSAQNIMDFNGIGTDIRPGQKIKIPKL